MFLRHPEVSTYRSLAFLLYLVNKLPPEWVVFFQYICPELGVLPAHQIASLTLKQGVLIAHLKEKLQLFAFC